MLFLLNRYCSNLDKDGVIMLYPKWKMFDLSIDGSPQFRCHLILPPNAIVREEVEVNKAKYIEIEYHLPFFCLVIN